MRQYVSLEIITFDPSLYAIDYPAFIVYYFIVGNSIGLKRVNN